MTIQNIKSLKCDLHNLESYSFTLPKFLDLKGQDFVTFSYLCKKALTYER